jgi:hypothetical protein
MPSPALSRDVLIKVVLLDVVIVQTGSVRAPFEELQSPLQALLQRMEAARETTAVDGHHEASPILFASYRL